MRVKINHKLKIALPVALLLLGVLYIYSFLFHSDGDEAILAEQAQMLVRNGFVSSPMFEGIGQGWEIIQLHYHKFFIWLGALVYSVFGASFYAFRFLSVLFFGGVILLVYYIMKVNKTTFVNILSFLVLLLSNYVFFRYGLIYRPEIAVMFFALLTFYLLQKWKNNNRICFLLIAAVSAGLGALSHLNGLSICLAGVVLLFFSKKYIQAISFGAVSGFVSLFYFIDINSREKINIFLKQFSNDPNLDAVDLSYLGPLVKLANEHMRYFWNAEVAVFSVLLIFVTIFAFKYLWNNHKDIIVFSLTLAVGLGAVSQGKTIKYGLMILPFYIIIVLYGIENIIHNSKKYLRVTLFVIVAVYLGVNIYASVKMAGRFYPVQSRSEFIATYMPNKNVRIYAPAYFFFKQGENYKLSHPIVYDVLTQNYLDNPEQSAESFYEFYYRLNTEYIILDSLAMPQGRGELTKYSSLHMNDTLYNYKVCQEFDTWKLLQKNN